MTTEDDVERLAAKWRVKRPLRKLDEAGPAADSFGGSLRLSRDSQSLACPASSAC
jgi:hypothetical protein